MEICELCGCQAYGLVKRPLPENIAWVDVMWICEYCAKKCEEEIDENR
jgi:hypothetical protein